ncbi:hypothetical protein [Embleya sp. NPDC059259]|uniref:hypothetical protein n=1 Tax=unclassified Embleya TaxID=2699296 RepID=UPI00368AB105
MGAWGMARVRPNGRMPKVRLDKARPVEPARLIEATSVDTRGTEYRWSPLDWESFMTASLLHDGGGLWSRPETRANVVHWGEHLVVDEGNAR